MDTYYVGKHQRHIYKDNLYPKHKLKTMEIRKHEKFHLYTRELICRDLTVNKYAAMNIPLLFCKQTI